MLRSLLALGFVALTVGLAAWPSARADEKGDTQIGVLAGEWKVEYTHGAVRNYAIEKDGKVAGTADDEKLTGQISRKEGILFLIFEGDGKLERLTLGSDGRLFVEHYNPKENYPDGKASHIGIGVRQK